MSLVSGACLVNKVSGMVSIREDVTPLVLEWKAIDQLTSLTIPLVSLTNLKASKESSPNMMLQIVYNTKETTGKKLVLAFTNRPTMNNIKESLQTIVARLRTVIKDSPTPSEYSSAQSTPAPNQPQPSGNGGITSKLGLEADNLSDHSLLKNHQLQQKLLLEDKELRNVFTQSVINFKMSPNVFWLIRLNLLRTYALTVSQQRGPYNVLSTIRPVASSDNQVNVNVTRDTITAIFDTYPIVRKAFSDLVPLKFPEGEFWSRFFNSKLFRRLRGDKINNSNERGDFILDKYLYIDADNLEKEEMDSAQDGTSSQMAPDQEVQVSKFLDLMGNEEDNSQKLGNMPDVTMRFSDTMNQDTLNGSKNNYNTKDQENEMVILMKHMNKLSSKMVSMSYGFSNQDHSTQRDGLSQDELKEFEEELNLHDLNDSENLHFVKLDINTHVEKNGPAKASDPTNGHIVLDQLSAFVKNETFSPGPHGVNLADTYADKKPEINRAANDITLLMRANYRNFKLINAEASKDSDSSTILPPPLVTEIVTFNTTIMEFLSQFWKLFLNGSNPNQLKKLFTTLKNCKTTLTQLLAKITDSISNNKTVKENAKGKEKVIQDVVSTFSPLQIGIDKACSDYVAAVNQSLGTNENGKRPLED